MQHNLEAKQLQIILQILIRQIIKEYVKFEETLNNANKTGKIEVKTDTSGAVRTDGNNVDLESEKVNQAANTLMYNGLISLTNSKLSMAKSVITGR